MNFPLAWEQCNSFMIMIIIIIPTMISNFKGYIHLNVQEGDANSEILGVLKLLY